jgi:hypothetical protein
MYILTKDFNEENPRDFPFVNSRYEDYRQYLDSISEDLPISARAFALADWRLDPQNHKCPHDSWVESLSIFEVSSGERQQNRITEIVVKLLGAYHDGYLQLNYKNTLNYSLSKSGSDKSHGDWMYDEVRLSENGLVLHEIEFSNETAWIIECEDIEFTWTPIEL